MVTSHWSLTRTNASDKSLESTDSLFPNSLTDPNNLSLGADPHAVQPPHLRTQSLFCNLIFKCNVYSSGHQPLVIKTPFSVVPNFHNLYAKWGQNRHRKAKVSALSLKLQSQHSQGALLFQDFIPDFQNCSCLSFQLQTSPFFLIFFKNVCQKCAQKQGEVLILYYMDKEKCGDQWVRIYQGGALPRIESGPKFAA